LRNAHGFPTTTLLSAGRGPSPSGLSRLASVSPSPGAHSPSMILPSCAGLRWAALGCAVVWCGLHPHPAPRCLCPVCPVTPCSRLSKPHMSYMRHVPRSAYRSRPERHRQLALGLTTRIANASCARALHDVAHDFLRPLTSAASLLAGLGAWVLRGSCEPCGRPHLTSSPSDPVLI